MQLIKCFKPIFIAVFQEKPYFCIFCDQTFHTKSDASSHYFSHLCSIKCKKCDQKFASYDKFQCHNSQHLKDIEYCQHYRDTSVWINNFLHYQQREEIQTFVHKECIVCQRVQEYRPESKVTKSAAKGLLIDHLKEHLIYDPQYKCLNCLLNEDEDGVYCYNSGN